jgi:hypothetical protein
MARARARARARREVSRKAAKPQSRKERVGVTERDELRLHEMRPDGPRTRSELG